MYMQTSLNIKMVLLRGIDYFLNSAFIIMLTVLAALFIVAPIENHYKNNSLAEYFIFLILYLVVAFIYYFVFELLVGRTLSKFVTQTQVVDLNGQKISAKAAFIRTISRATPFNEFSIFFLNGRTFHDKFSDTFVVPSGDLPIGSRLPKKVNIIATVLICLLFVSPIIGIFGYSAYIELTGGDRIYVPNNLPSDFRLLSAKSVKHYDSSYEELVYLGNGRRVVMTWQIAGFEYDPDVDCSYMEPTVDTSYSKVTIDNAFVCKQIANRKDEGRTDGWYSLYKTEPYKALPVSDSAKLQIADYYLKSPPYRLNIKVESGGLSDQEVLAMYRGGFTEKTLGAISKDASNP